MHCGDATTDDATDQIQDLVEANPSQNHGVPLFFQTDSHPSSLSDLLQNHMSLAIFLEHMHKKFEINWTKMKGGCQSGRKVVTHNSKSDLPLKSVKH